jgi:hypothetical protein
MPENKGVPRGQYTEPHIPPDNRPSIVLCAYTTKTYNVYFVQCMAWNFLYFKDISIVLYIRDTDFRLWLDIHCLIPPTLSEFLNANMHVLMVLFAFLSGYS